jgi:hypothetical protein
MHSLLERYLEEVATQLKPLPAKRREEELREIRTHLENTVNTGQDHWLAEDDAVHEALQQFGEPKEVGRDIVTSWQRGESLANRSFWGAAVCVVGLTYLSDIFGKLWWRQVDLYVSPVHLRQTAHRLGLYETLWTELGILAVSLVLEITMLILVGWFSGYTFPKRAVPGAMLGVAVFNVITWMPGLYQFLTQPLRIHDVRISPAFTVLTVGFIVIITLLSCTITVYSARAGSRWREKRIRLALN